ncbi:hypothetical protein GC173_06075 [bacterium]|nr:hypothetical protein [bacterium]
MAVSLLAGRSGSGKTHHILEEVCAACAADPFGAPIFLLVPEQASYQTEKALLTHGPIRGYTRVQVLSFARLAQFVYTTNPAPTLPVLTNQHRDFLVLLLLHRWRRERPGTFLDTPGIEDSLTQLVAEARHQAVEATDLRRAVDQLSQGPEQDTPDVIRARILRDKLAILQEFLQLYDEMLTDRFHDPAHGLVQIAEAIRTTGTFQGATVYIDSFIDFTPVEEQLVVAIARRAARTVLSIQLEPARLPLVMAGRGGSHPIFGSTELALQRLFALLSVNGIDVRHDHEPSIRTGRRFRSNSLGELEATFLSGAPQFETQDKVITLIEAATPRDEARLAAEHTAALLRAHPDWSPAEIIILTRDLELYADALGRHLTELRVPHFVDRAVPLTTHPFVVGIRALLAAVQHPGDAVPLMELGKSGMLPVLREDVDFLDLHIRQYPRSRAEWLSDRPWNAPPDRSFADEEDERAPDIFSELVDQTRRRITGPVNALRTALKLDERREIPFHQFVEALFESISGIIDHDALPESEERILARIGELIAQAADVVAEDALPLDLCLQVLQHALSGLQLPRIPPLLDQIFVGQVDRSRQPPARVVIVVGLAEGGFPRPIANRTLLNDAERDLLEELDISLKPSARRLFQREALFAYRAFAAPSEQLILMRPRGTNDGAPLEPSPYWIEISRLLRCDAESAPPPEDTSRLWRPRELAAGLVLSLSRQARLIGADIPSDVVLARYLGELAAAPEVGAVLRAARWKNEASISPEQVRRHLDSRIRLSATHLDSFGACPYQYFVKYLLRPHELVSPEFELLDAGNYAHRVLETFSRIVRERDLLSGPADTDPDAIIEEALRGPRLSLEKTGLLGTASGRFLHERLDESLRQMCHWLVSTWRGSNTRPAAEEIPSKWYANELAPSSDWQVSISGKIDRLDSVINGEETMGVVVDYKLSGRRFDFSKWMDGQNSQLPLYLMALDQNLGQGKNPGGAVYLEILPSMADGEEKERKYRGLISLTGLFSMAGEGDLGIPKLAGFDIGATDPRKDTPRSGGLLTDQQLEAVVLYTKRIIANSLSQIIGGGFQVFPSRLGSETPCSFCDKQKICQIDYSINRANHRVRKSREQVLHEILEQIGEQNS